MTIGLDDDGRGWNRGSCHSRAGGCGPGNGDGTRREASLAIDDTETRVVGSLEPSVIDARVKAHLAQLRACYERELSAKPSLQGKLLVHFTIEADGRVSGATMATSTMGDATVEGCVADRFTRILFPRPSGGGIVVVNYPLLFKSAGE